jgi:uncharacterized protein
MGAAAASFLVVVAFLTATLSGVFGMAGGLVLMGALAFLLPVSVAFVTHGILQLVANGWRAILHRKHIAWPVLGWFLIAALLATGIVSLFTIIPSKFTLFLLLGLVPLVIWLPRTWVVLDAANPVDALIFGTLTSVLNLTAGVAGPLLDMLFVRTGLSRHQIVATKAAIQSLNHVAKIIVYGLMLGAAKKGAMPPLWLFALAAPASMIGTVAGGCILDRMSDVNFKRWTAWIITAIGLIYLARAAELATS